MKHNLELTTQELLSLYEMLVLNSQEGTIEFVLKQKVKDVIVGALGDVSKRPASLEEIEQWYAEQSRKLDEKIVK